MASTYSSISRLRLGFIFAAISAVAAAVTTGWAAEISVATPDNVDPGFANPRDVVMTDWDRDGDLDIVVASFSRVAWIENRLDEPSADWTTHDVDTTVTAASSVQVADITGDGAEEIIAGCVNVALLAYWQPDTVVTGSWSRTTIQSNRAVADLGLADLDQDGDLDLFGFGLGRVGDLSVGLTEIQLTATIGGTPMTGPQVDALFDRVWVTRADGTPAILGEVTGPDQASVITIPLDSGGNDSLLEAPTNSTTISVAALEIHAELEPDAADSIPDFELTVTTDFDAFPADDSLGTPLTRYPRGAFTWVFTVSQSQDSIIFADGFESGGTTSWSSTTP